MKFLALLMFALLAGCISSNDESRPEDGVYGTKLEVPPYATWYELDYPKMSYTTFRLDAKDASITKYVATGTYEVTRSDSIEFTVEKSASYNAETGDPEGNWSFLGGKYFIDDDWCLVKSGKNDKHCRE